LDIVDQTGNVDNIGGYGPVGDELSHSLGRKSPFKNGLSSDSERPVMAKGDISPDLHLAQLD
jgi:hypothetical protein